MTLFDPIQLGRLTIRNRIMMSPMSQRAAGEDARATDWHLVHYGSRAVGGCGLVMVEDTAVTPMGRTSHAALGLYEPEQAESLRRIVDFCHSQGAFVGLQLAHAGRKGLADTRGTTATISASPLAYGPGWIAPLEASDGDLSDVTRAFVASTGMALQAGFDVVEVHAAHGYLLHQFLSPLTNLRDDAYGGATRGRMRLLVEVVQAVRGQWPAGRPLFVRLPAGDGQPGGLGIEEMVECARACALAGAQLIDITGGTPLLEGRRASSADVLALAEALAGRPPEPGADGEELASLPVALGGGILDGESALTLLRDHGASLVSVGRPLLGDPYWPLRAAHELGVAPPLAPTYRDALPGGEDEFPLAFGGAVFSPDHSKQVEDRT
jgi:2,4-dienoyl-CoA reductase-like NADH-dependent reductase (Old Yellow Enzyme family)